MLLILVHNISVRAKKLLQQTSKACAQDNVAVVCVQATRCSCSAIPHPHAHLRSSHPLGNMSDAAVADEVTRRSQRERKKPTPIYQVLDVRLSNSQRDGDGGASDTGAGSTGDDDDSLDESESTDNDDDDDEDEEADARQFVLPKPKPRAPRPGPAKRKPATLVRPRKLKPVLEERASTRKGSDASSDNGDSMLFGASPCVTVVISAVGAHIHVNE